MTREAKSDEIEFANNKNNPLEKQKEIHNSIFDNARRIFQKDIQTFEQLGKYVIEHPDKADEITDIVEQSGYLTLWQIDIESNPWYYDYSEFLKHFKNPEQRRDIGYYFATTEEETRERFSLTLSTLKFGYSFHKQKYFKIMIELYEKLIELSETREFVGILALKN